MFPPGRAMRGNFLTLFSQIPPYKASCSAHTDVGVMTMSKQEKDRTPVLRLEPEKRLCPAYDPVTIARYPVADPDEMGFRVLDNFPEEHIQ